MNAATGYADVLVGLQYGDEGKAKIVDRLAGDYDILARFNGGANAGHTVDSPQGRARLAQVPSGVFHPKTLLYIGSGCVVNLTKLSDEIDTLANIGIGLHDRLFVSEECALIQPAHLEFDAGNGADIGTTGNGVGPCYAGLALRSHRGVRTALQVRDLIVDEAWTFAQMAQYASLSGNAPEDETSRALTIATMREAWERLRDTITVVDSQWITRKVMDGARVLFEGAQSVMLDVTAGAQPYVTSSHTSPSFAFVGGDLPCKYHRKTIGVAKAIVSRVGSGPFRSEFGGARSARYCADAALQGIGWREETNRFDPDALLSSDDDFSVGIALRILTREYGTGSGRPRRLGRLDLAQLAEVVKRHGVDELYLNKCDCLSLFSKTRDGQIPVLVNAPGAGTLAPELRHFPAFDALPTTLNAFTELPRTLQKLLQTIQKFSESRLVGIGFGPGREQLLTITEGDISHDT